jgi:hypothetical protein
MNLKGEELSEYLVDLKEYLCSKKLMVRYNYIIENENVVTILH